MTIGGRRMGTALLCLVGALAAARGAAATVAAAGRDGGGYYVSPAGNDAWSGTRAGPNWGRSDGPFATLERARDAVRALKAGAGGLKQPVTVYVRAGMYALARPLVFTSADSGTEACPVTFQAYADERPVISGGRRIAGWKRDQGPRSVAAGGGTLWCAELPECRGEGGWDFNQLFVNGRRCVRARIPNLGGFLRTAGPVAKDNATAFLFNPGDLRPWVRAADALVVVYHSWETSLHHLTAIAEAYHVACLREPAPWAMGTWEPQQRYYVENLPEALDAPGEWYLDRAAGTLRYCAREGEDMSRAEVVAPTLTTTLLELRGDDGTGGRVEHLRFAGLAFQHTNARLTRIRNCGQGEVNQNALIMLTDARNVCFERCEVAHAGGHAVWLAEGCDGCVLSQCHLFDLAGGGVYVGGGWGVHDQRPARSNVVDNCFIHDGGHVFHGAHGVWIGCSSFNSVTHNEIADFDYSGISCGWSWGFQPSSANHNALDYNSIHHLGNGEGLSDMGGIYTLGISPGTTERGNRIHDVYNYAPVSHGSGIYPDEGSSEILIENNVVYRVRTCPVFQHYGKDNLLRNNVFAFGGEGQLQRCREDVPCHYIAERNVVYADIPQMLGGVWDSGNWRVASNLYWSTAGAPRFKGMDFTAWQAKGYDVGSIVADPLFVAPAAGDFRLKPGSPALALGFKPIDPAAAGLYGDKEWVRLPRRYPNRPRNEVPPAPRQPAPVNLDFERADPGTEPAGGSVVLSRALGSIRVSRDTAASGQQSLRFTDAPGQAESWTPHIYFNPLCDTGAVSIAWDMLNSREAPDSFCIEARQWDVNPYRTGPSVYVEADGRVTAGGRPVGTLPPGVWAHVDLAFTLGPGAPRTYRLTLTVPGRDPVRLELPYAHPEFERLTWFGVSSLGTASSAFYLDNLKCGTPDALARPPRLLPTAQELAQCARPRRQPPAGGDAALAAEWRFGEGTGDSARDSSGWGNRADMSSALWGVGPFGSALCAQPSQPCAVVPDDPTLQFGRGSFTVELWLCPATLDIASADKRRRFMSKGDFPRTWWNLNLTADGRPYLEMRDSGGVDFAGWPSGAIPAGAWSHFVVAVDREARQVRYFLNGRLDTTLPLPDGFQGEVSAPGGSLQLGSDWQPFLGLLDEIRIHHRALDATAVAAVYNRERPQRTRSEYTARE